MISFLPGPVEIGEQIQRAFRLPPIYHRSLEFVSRFELVRSKLAHMTGASHVALFNGSGTLANEVVASCLEGPGVVLANGEFGSRLARQAERWQLPVRVIEWPWGVPWDLARVDAELGRAEWIWAVHLETSTGMLNDVAQLGTLARRRGVRLALDCVSSLGAVPVDLKDVWLASGTSGKALGSYAGISVVFAAEPPHLHHEVPTYLDLRATLRATGSCFTFPSPLVWALDAALDMERDYQPMGWMVRTRLREIGTLPLVDESFAAPVVTTFLPPARNFIGKCRSLGFHIGGESGYLMERGWVQIATMGAVRPRHVTSLFDRLA